MPSFTRAMHPLRAALLFLLLSPALAQLLWSDGSSSPRDIVELPNFGDGEKQLTVLYKPAEGEESSVPVVSESDLYTVSLPVVDPATNGFTNYTYTLALTGEVGTSELTVSAGSDKLTATFIAAGFVILDGGKIVSGDDREGVSVGQEGQTEYDVRAVGTDGKSVDVSGVKIEARPGSGTVYFEEVDADKTVFSADKFTLAINKFRVGTGSILLSFEAPSIEKNGEIFETVLHVTQSTTPAPPCVVEGAKLVSRSGIVEASMFNLLTPPLSSPVTEIRLSIGGSSYDYDTSLSTLVNPTSTVKFSSVPGTGEAKITCDGNDAVVLEDGVVASGLTVVNEDGSTSEPLAKDTLIEPLPSAGPKALINSTIRVVDSDPGTLTKSDAETIKDEYCSTVSSSDCVIISITSGSAILTFGAVVDDADASKKNVKDAFDSCDFQTNTGYACDKLQLGGSQTVNVAGATAAGTAGIATWTIVLISCVGAFALIAVAALTLWAVHRRSSQLSESSYSSSGPMGVPDPSDLLYEQSIVRDIYGRGEDGGPTAEAAQQSEMAASMREEFPRPPSSGSGLSRGRAASLDASSTYSV